MVKQPTSESSEFTMSSEDFPALPGTASTEGPSPGSSVVSSSDKSTSQAMEQNSSQQDLVNSRLVISNDKTLALKRGIQTSPDGKQNSKHDIYLVYLVVKSGTRFCLGKCNSWSNTNTFNRMCFP